MVFSGSIPRNDLLYREIKIVLYPLPQSFIMKKIKNISFALITCCFFGIFSCSKKNEIPPKLISTAENLVDRYYILVSSVSKPAYPDSYGNYIVDIYEGYYRDPCVLDDLKMFKSNGDYIFDNGVTKCYPLEKQTAISKWRFLDNNTVIQIYNGTDTTNNVNNLKVLVNDGKFLKYEMKINGKDNGVTKEYTWTETWRVYP